MKEAREQTLFMNIADLLKAKGGILHCPSLVDFLFEHIHTKK